MARAWLEPNDHPERVAEWGMTIEFLPSADSGKSGGEAYDGSLTALLDQALEDARVAEIFVWSAEQRDFLPYDHEAFS